MTAAHLIKIDVIVTLSEDSRIECPAWPNNPVRVHWTVDDPMSVSSTAVREWKFKKCYATLENRISALIKNRVSSGACELLLQLKNVGMVV